MLIQTIIYFMFLLFMLFVPFSGVPAFLVLHIVTSINLLIHWYKKSDKCTISYYEAKLFNKEEKDTFMHQLVAPVYLTNSKILMVIVLILMCISIYNLYLNKYKFKVAYENCSKPTITGNGNGNATETLIKLNNCIWPIFLPIW